MKGHIITPEGNEVVSDKATWDSMPSDWKQLAAFLPCPACTTAKGEKADHPAAPFAPFDPADPNLVGRRCTWNVYGIQYAGTIVQVIETDGLCYRKGDWSVKVDTINGKTTQVNNYASVIGHESKLI